MRKAKAGVRGPRNVADSDGNLRQVVVLAEDQHHIQFSASSHPHGVEAGAKVDSLFTSNRRPLHGPVGQGNSFGPIAEVMGIRSSQSGSEYHECHGNS